MLRATASPKAFTLIEVMMAATILVVSFSAVIMAVGQGADMIDSARKQQIAQQIIEGEIAFQRSSTWLWSPPNTIGLQEMINTPKYEITVDATGTAAIDQTANGRDDLDAFILDSNPALLLQAKGFTCTAQGQPIRGSPTMIKITWTVTWTSSGRSHSRTAMSYFTQNGLHLSYQK